MKPLGRKDGASCGVVDIDLPKVSLNAPCAVLGDNYIIHKSEAVQKYLRFLDDRIVLLFLPPCSPNENKIEGLWKQLHDNVTRNHKHKEIDGLIKDVKRFLRRCQSYPGAKVSLMSAAA